jgi:hypothetical protein
MIRERFRQFFARRNAIPEGRWYFDQAEDQVDVIERMLDTAADYLDALAPGDASRRGGPLTHADNCAVFDRPSRGCSCGGRIDDELAECDCAIDDACPQGRTGNGKRCWIRRKRVRS